MTISAYPLQWPAGWKRTPTTLRRPAKFSRGERKYTSYTDAQGRAQTTSHLQQRDLTIADARRRVLAELLRMGLQRDDVVISTNLPLRLDGEPRSDARNPDDPGAAVYWLDPFNSAPRVMAIDQYLRVADNLAAIAATLDAMRAIERHGGAVILERAFTGFTALPAPGQGVKRDWWVVLDVDRATVTREGCKVAYRRLASQYHPDKPGGSHEAMAELNAAQDAALKEVVR